MLIAGLGMAEDPLPVPGDLVGLNSFLLPSDHTTHHPGLILLFLQFFSFCFTNASGPFSLHLSTLPFSFCLSSFLKCWYSVLDILLFFFHVLFLPYLPFPSPILFICESLPMSRASPFPEFQFSLNNCFLTSSFGWPMATSNLIGYQPLTSA